MKILVFGKNGQVATELQRQAEVIALSRQDADLCDPEACAKIISEADVDIVINAAAYTAVDAAEADHEIARLINADSPAAMAISAAKRKIPFLHISSDYVFDGSGVAPWKRTSSPAPLGVYGETKWQGEVGVTKAGGPHAILRTSWVFSAHGNNFVTTMLRLGKEREELGIVNDQVGGPTAAADIAATLLTMATAFYEGRGENGIFHYSGGPDVSWEGFAREIFRQAGISVKVSGIPTSAYPTPAARPLNSRLDCLDLETYFAIPRPDWKRSLNKVLLELGEVS